MLLFVLFFREDWIQAIQSVAEQLQVLDESDLPPNTLQELEESKPKKNKVVSLVLLLGSVVLCGVCPPSCAPQTRK